MAPSRKSTQPERLKIPLTTIDDLALADKATEATELKVLKKRSLKFGKNLRLPFSFKLGLALSFLAVGVATGSICWMQFSIQRNLLTSTAQELKTLGIQKGLSFSATEIAEIEQLLNEVNLASLPLSEQEITIEREKKRVNLPGLAKNIQKKIESSKRYQNLAQKLGEITNQSRRDGSSDIYVRTSHLMTIVPNFPNREMFRILVSDRGYRYEGKITENLVDYLGAYYLPASHSIRLAFNGTPQVDTQYYYENRGRNGSFISTGIPLKNKLGSVVAVLVLDLEVSSIAIQVNELNITALQIVGISLIISLIVASLLSRWLTRPISKLYQASEQIRNHNFDITIDIDSNDEFQQLAEAFEVMIADVGRYTNNLEDLVVERTNKLNQAKKELELDIEKGQALQRNFLPNPILTIPNWEICAAFEPAKKVAGDFYDVFLLPDGSIGLVIADVCDKGVGAAMFMGLFRSFIRLFSGATNLQFGDSSQPDRTAVDWTQKALQAIELTNNYISEEHGETGMFATIFFGILNPETGLLTYINGGHESPLIINSNGIKTALKFTGSAVGMMPNSKFKIKQFQLEPGDILFGYTDGLTDARNPSREFFTEKRVLSLLNQPYSSATELLECMKTNVFTHIDCAAQFDDITLLAVRRKNSNTS